MWSAFSEFYRKNLVLSNLISRHVTQTSKQLPKSKDILNLNFWYQQVFRSMCNADSSCERITSGVWWLAWLIWIWIFRTGFLYFNNTNNAKSHTKIQTKHHCVWETRYFSWHEKLKTLRSPNNCWVEYFLLKFCTSFPLTNVYKMMFAIFLFCLDLRLLAKI